MRTNLRSRLVRRTGQITVPIALALTVASTVSFGVLGSSGAATNAPRSQTAQISISPSATSQLAGAPQTYNIALACQGVGGSECGPNTTITIPLSSTVVPSMTTGGWLFGATSGTGSLITSGPTIVGNNLVLHLNDSEFIGGYSGTIRLTMTPPNSVTPNNTSWQVAPTLSGDSIDSVTVATPTTSTATAKPLVSVAKATADGGSVYEVDKDVTFNITAKCSSASLGNLFLDSAALIDTLPAGLTYVSSTPMGTYDSGTNTVTWPYTSSDPKAFPAGCNASGTGTTTFKVVAHTPPTPPAIQPITNRVTFQGTGPDATNPAGISSSSAAQVPIEIVKFPNPSPGPGYASIYKSSLAPIPQAGITSGNQYVATYPGNWVPLASNPNYSVTAAAASFQTTVSYGLVGRYQTTLYDPVPCLTNLSGGNKYSSNGYNEPACTSVAFHTQLFSVYSPGYDTSVNGFGRAYASGWRPQAILVNGSTITLNATGSVSTTASSANFAVPSGDDIATIVLPPNPALVTKTLQLTMWGYADSSLESLNSSVNELHNVATAVPQLDGTDLSPISYGASVFTVPPIPQLGISKSFGALGGGPNGTTLLNLVGSVNLPHAPLNNNVVITDLLPLGLTWANPSTSATFTIAQGRMAPISVTATIALLSNYQGSGRQLIRITIPSSSFTSTGSWIITPPANLLEMVTPTTLGVYANTDQIFLFGLGSNPLNPVCSTPTQTGGGISPATFESDNALDLAGDGNLSEAYCQNSASLVVQGTGAAFALTKTVQGDLDNLPRGPLGIGNASPGGFGDYNLTWANVGSDKLARPVIYDILPFVGDTGVSAGQSSVPRGSQFTPIFDAAIVPTGVTVAYSTSTNPCRPEVYPNDIGCDPTWTTTPPSPLTSVKSLRFTSSASYVNGQSFSVGIKVSVPSGVVNQVAWNSAATNATDLTDPSTTPLPAEPPKVGLVAPSTPVITSVTSTTSTTAFSSLSDEISISGTGGAPGTLLWTLFGPIDPNGTSCEGLSWKHAPITATGSVPISGDGTVTTGPTTIGKGGCYSWGDELLGTSYPYGATLPPGSPHEQTVALPFPPTINTTATKSTAGDGTQSVSDSIVIGGIPDLAPVPSPLTWTLYGPIIPKASETCAQVSWTAAPVLASGTTVITGNGTFETDPVALSAPGCYSYGQVLPATEDSIAVEQAPGVAAESVEATPPTMSTSTSDATAAPYQSVTDTVTIHGTNGGSGTLHWSLVGPVAATGASCVSADYTKAPTVASGSVDVTADGTYHAGPATVTHPGCYSWVESLTSASHGAGFPGPIAISAGASGEVILVKPHAPTITTAISSTTLGSLGSSVHDSITVAGSGLAQGPGSATAAALTWSLLGPVAAQSGSCTNVAWSAAPTAGSGTLTINSDGTFATANTTLSQAGCYTFTAQLPATTDQLGVSSPPGLPEETVLVTPAPSPSGGGGGLAFTGWVPRPWLAAGISAIFLGGVLLAVARRRRTS